MRYGILGLALVVSCGLLLADRVEAAKRRPPARQSRLRRAKSYMSAKDKNKDGKLSPREFGLKPELFSKADKNTDGFVSQGELVMLAGFQTGGLEVAYEPEDLEIDKVDAFSKGKAFVRDHPGSAFEPGFFCKPVPAACKGR